MSLLKTLINILKIRKKLDKLDNELLKIIKKKNKFSYLILKIKNIKEIVDKKRIKVILNNIQEEIIEKKKIDIIDNQKIWTSMIKAYIEYEFRNFSKKKYYLL